MECAKGKDDGRTAPALGYFVEIHPEGARCDPAYYKDRQQSSQRHISYLPSPDQPSLERSGMSRIAARQDSTWAIAERGFK